MIGSFNWFFNFFPPCLFCFIALPVRTAPTPFREMFAEDPLPVLGAGSAGARGGGRRRSRSGWSALRPPGGAACPQRRRCGSL